MTGSEVYPVGLAAVLDHFAGYGLPILISENGVATEDDQLRCRFLKDHLRVIADKIAAGIEVIGYLHWSMIDNFEWALGFGPKFGLASFDAATMERSARPSAELYAEICRTGRLD